jgi:hypothetical protein
MIGARMKRIIIRGAMNHDSGAEIAKLLTTTAGIQKKAWAISAGTLTTKITPIPNATAFTMHQISAATRSLARLSLSMAFPLSLGKCRSGWRLNAYGRIVGLMSLHAPEYVMISAATARTQLTSSTKRTGLPKRPPLASTGVSTTCFPSLCIEISCEGPRPRQLTGLQSR